MKTSLRVRPCHNWNTSRNFIYENRHAFLKRKLFSQLDRLPTSFSLHFIKKTNPNIKTYSKGLIGNPKMQRLSEDELQAEKSACAIGSHIQCVSSSKCWVVLLKNGQRLDLLRRKLSWFGSRAGQMTCMMCRMTLIGSMSHEITPKPLSSFSVPYIDIFVDIFFPTSSHEVSIHM